jgi:hypothetical protein
MYGNKYDVELRDETHYGKKMLMWFVAFMFVVTIAAWFLNHAGDAADNAVVRYEEFQEIYNTTQKLNQDLCLIKDVPEADKMFRDFSKAERANSIRFNLNRWIGEYNAKSRMINHSLWKSKSLPYQLSTQDFSCY